MKSAIRRLEEKQEEYLEFSCRGDYYVVNKHGQILQANNTYNEFGDSWLFLGVSTHHWHSHITIPFNEIWKRPKEALKGIVWDLDHNTTRLWGGQYCGKLPRITSIWKSKSQ